MKPFYQVQKILTLAASPNKSLHAALWSDQIAAAFQSQVVLYDAIAPTISVQGIPIASKYSNYRVLLQSSNVRMSILAQHITRARQVRHVSELGVSLSSLIAQAQRENADLIILNVPKASDAELQNFSAIMYGSPCPVFIGRSDKVPSAPKKILVPVRLKEGLEQKIPATIAWAKAYDAMVFLSVFEPYNATDAELRAVERLTAKFRKSLQAEGIQVQTDTLRGTHFGRTMLQSAAIHQVDMVLVAVDVANVTAQEIKKRMGKYFLDHSPVPVLAVPIKGAPAMSAVQAQRSI